MYSIRETLTNILFIVLLIIISVFTCFVLALYFGRYGTTPETYAQIISALATVLVLILTLGLRLIDDALMRFENFVKPKINNIVVLCGPSGLAGEIEKANHANLAGRCADVDRSSKRIIRHGSFLQKSLYPKEAMSKIPQIIKAVKEYDVLLHELAKYWNRSEFDNFLTFMTEGEKGFKDWIFLFEGREQRKIVQNEIPDLSTRIHSAKETILQDLKVLISELEDFLEAN